MTTLRWRKVLRELSLHRARAVLVVLAIAVGITSAGAVLDKWALLRVVTREGYLVTHPASATLHTRAVDAALLARVAALPQVERVQARRSVLAAVRAGGSWRTAQLIAVDDFARQRIHVVRPLAGAWPPADGALVVESSSQERAAFALGDRVTVRIGEGPQRALEVSGIARDSGLAPGWMEGVAYGFVTPGTLARLGAGSELDQLQLVVRDRSMSRQAVRAVAVAAQRLVEASGRPVRRVEVPEPGTHVHARQMDSLLLTQGAFGALALLLSGFLVVNLMAALLVGQAREIGIFKAIGGAVGQIASLYLSLALLLGAAATLVAVPLAALLGRRYAELGAELLNFDLAGHSIPAWAVVLQLAVGLLLPVAAAALPVWRACRVPVGVALRDLGIGAAAGDLGLVRWLLRLRAPSRPLLLSLRNAARRRVRVALTVATLALGGGVFLAALDLRSAVRGTVDHLFGTLLRYDGTLRLARPYPTARVERAAAAVAGVGRAEAWGSAAALVARGDGLAAQPFALRFVPPATTLLAFPLDAGRWLAADDGASLVLGRDLAAREELRVGEVATLMIAGRSSRWRVVGIAATGPGATAYAPRRALALLGRSGQADTVAIARRPGDRAAPAPLVRRVRHELAAGGLEVSSAQVLAASRRAIEDHLLMVVDFLRVMSLLVLLVGGLGLASTMSLAVLERIREIGVLRALGASHSRLHAIVQGEGLVIALLGWLLAIPLSLPLAALLAERFGRIFLPVADRQLPELSGVLAWLLVAVGASLLACAWPAWRATRVSAARALAYE